MCASLDLVKAIEGGERVRDLDIVGPKRTSRSAKRPPRSASLSTIAATCRPRRYIAAVAPTQVLCTVIDLRTLVDHTYVLGELRQVYRQEVSVGRDPGCDIILDDPEILPRHALLSAASNHRMRRMLENGADALRERHDGHPFQIGPFGMLISETDDIGDIGPPPPELPVRFGGARGIGIATANTASPRVDPRRQETRRLFNVLRTDTGHVQEIDDAVMCWCAGKLDEHFALLSQATAPRPTLIRRRIEYTSSLAYTRARWDSEWSAIECGRFVAETWSYVHRLALWIAEHDQFLGRYPLWSLTQALLRPEIGRWTTEVNGRDVPGALAKLVSAHLATLDDERSPVRPLIELAERGVFAFALPGAATLLYIPSCRGERSAVHCSDHAEAPFLRALADDPADHELRLVYADLLEQRGDPVRAERLRAEASGCAPADPRVQRVEDLYSDAGALFLPRASHAPNVWPVIASGHPPAGAHVEVVDLRDIPLVHPRTGIAIQDDTVEVRDVDRDPSFEPHAIITYADGTFWIRALSYHHLAVNRGYGGGTADRPLFDGDQINLTWKQLVLHVGPGSRAAGQ